METIIRRNKSIKPRKSILIVGLPGIGNVGKLVAEHLRREFKAVRFEPSIPRTSRTRLSC